MSGETERIDSTRANTREPGFRRFSDRMMVASCSLVLALVAAVWAITWGTTVSQVTEVGGRVGATEQIQKNHVERIIKLEVLQDQTERHLGSIDAKQSQMEGKIESVQQSINQVLLELRKSK